MTRQPKPRHICRSMRATGHQDRCCSLVGHLHCRERSIDPSGFRLAAHFGRKQRAGPEWLGQNQHVTHAHAALPQNTAGIDGAIDREAEREFASFSAVSPDKRAPLRLQHVQPSPQNLKEIFFHFARVRVRDDRCCERR